LGSFLLQERLQAGRGSFSIATRVIFQPYDKRSASIPNFYSIFEEVLRTRYPTLAEKTTVELVHESNQHLLDVVKIVSNPWGNPEDEAAEVVGLHTIVQNGVLLPRIEFTPPKSVIGAAAPLLRKAMQCCTQIQIRSEESSTLEGFLSSDDDEKSHEGREYELLPISDSCEGEWSWLENPHFGMTEREKTPGRISKKEIKKKQKKSKKREKKLRKREQKERKKEEKKKEKLANTEGPRPLYDTERNTGVEAPPQTTPCQFPVPPWGYIPQYPIQPVMIPPFMPYSSSVAVYSAPQGYTHPNWEQQGQ